MCLPSRQQDIPPVNIWHVALQQKLSWGQHAFDILTDLAYWRELRVGVLLAKLEARGLQQQPPLGQCALCAPQAHHHVQILQRPHEHAVLSVIQLGRLQTKAELRHAAGITGNKVLLIGLAMRRTSCPAVGS